MKRLLFVLYELAYGGVERQAELLAEAGAALGHQVTLLVLGSDGPAHDRFVKHCTKIIILNAPLRNDYQLRQAVQQAVAGQQFDLAFLFSTAKMTVVSNALRAVVQKHVVPVGNPVSSNGLDYYKLLFRNWLFPPATSLHLVANSQHTLSSLKAHPYYRRFPLHVSLNSVRIPEKPVTLREVCKPLRIGMVARLDQIKDHATLIHAVALLQQQNFPIQCELLGRGALEDELKKLAQELHVLDKSVFFRGWVAQVEESLQQWDMFVFSTTAQEGFGNAAAEAMAYGLPCVLTDIGPCREVGSDAVEYVLPLQPDSIASRIKMLAGDSGLRQRMGAAAYQRAREFFSPVRNLQDYLQIAFGGRQA